MTWETIGSLNIEKDIDTIITKRPSSSTSSFYREVHNIFDKIESFLYEQYKIKVIRFSTMGQETLTKEISNLKKVFFFIL